MKPILALAGGIILVVLAVATYFVPAGYQQSSAFSSSQPVVVTPPSDLTLVGSLPVQVTVTNLPGGATVQAMTCPGGDSVNACLASYHGFNVTYTAPAGGTSSATFTLSVAPGRALVLETSAGAIQNVQVTASVPLWAEYTWVLAILIVASLALLILGLIGHARAQRPTDDEFPPAGPSRARPAAPGSPAPRRFCEACGARYTSPSDVLCPACGAPRPEA